MQKEIETNRLINSLKLKAHERLDVYLVTNGIKPSAILHSRSMDMKEVVKIADACGLPHLIRNAEREGHYFRSLYLGKDRKALMALLYAKIESQIGIALGYPSDASRAYETRSIADKKSDPVILAKRAGIKLPDWLPYLNHVPKELDFINGSISESSESLSKIYRNFVRKNNPELAKIVEGEYMKALEEDIAKELIRQ